MADTTNTTTAAPAATQPEDHRLVTEADIQAAREHIADAHNGEQLRSAIGQLRRNVVIEMAARGLIPSFYGAAPAATQPDKFCIDACEEAFVRDFCPYQGSPDPLVVWRAAWQAALAAPAAQEAEPVAYCQPDDPNPSEAFSWPGHCRQEHHTIPLYARPPRPQADAGAVSEGWLQLRNSLAMFLLGWAERKPEDQSVDKANRALDAITEPGLPLAILRSAPDWRAAAPQAPAAATNHVAAFWASVEDGTVFDDISPETWHLVDKLVEQLKAAGDTAFFDGAPAPAAAVAPAYADSTPHLHVGDSAFEDWFQRQPFATQQGVKQIARDAYAAGMGDPLVAAARARQEGSGA